MLLNKEDPTIITVLLFIIVLRILLNDSLIGKINKIAL